MPLIISSFRRPFYLAFEAKSVVLPPKVSQNESSALSVGLGFAVQPINITATAMTTMIDSILIRLLHIIFMMSLGVFPYISISLITPRILVDSVL